MERKTRYVGSSPIEVFRVKSSHSCWVKCKKNASCSRFTYLPGDVKRCELYKRGDRSLRKEKSSWAISGYARWRIEVKNWPKQKATAAKKGGNKKKPKPDKKKDKYGGEEAYEAPGFNGGGGEEAYEAPGFIGGGGGGGAGNFIGGAYEDPNFGSNDDWTMPGGGNMPISDYTLMTGKTIYGRRINSILNCVGNIARRHTDCQSACQQNGNCAAWTWASFDCSWVGDSQDSGVCYMMSDSDTDDVFTAPNDGDFISGIVRSGGGSGDGSGAYEDPGAFDGGYDGGYDSMPEGPIPLYDSNGNCLVNC